MLPAGAFTALGPRGPSNARTRRRIGLSSLGTTVSMLAVELLAHFDRDGNPPAILAVCLLRKRWRPSPQPRVSFRARLKNVGCRVTALDRAISDDEGHSYRLVDAFGTRSFAFVCSMLEGLAGRGAELAGGVIDQWQRQL